MNVLLPLRELDKAGWALQIKTYLNALREVDEEMFAEWYLMDDTREEALQHRVDDPALMMSPTLHLWAVAAWNGQENDRGVTITGWVGSTDPKFPNNMLLGLPDGYPAERIRSHLKESGLWIEPSQI